MSNVKIIRSEYYPQAVFTAILRRLMSDNHISISELAKDSGLSRQTITKIFDSEGKTLTKHSYCRIVFTIQNKYPDSAKDIECISGEQYMVLPLGKPGNPYGRKGKPKTKEIPDLIDEIPQFDLNYGDDTPITKGQLKAILERIIREL